MNISDKLSLCSFNSADYIDLETALIAEDSHSETTRNNGREDSYRFSLKSIEPAELDIFRRSLVTPMSLNSKSQDPIYANKINNRSNYNYSKTSPVLQNNRHSPSNESIAESIALFNNISNGETTTVDFVNNDLNDFMGSYNMDDLISRPSSSNNFIPSPQSRRTSTNLENINKVTPSSITNPKTNDNNQRRDTIVKTTFDGSVKNQRRVSSPAIIIQEQSPVPIRTISKERLEKRLDLSKPKESNKSQRWSSYIPDNKQDKLNQLGAGVSSSKLTEQPQLNRVNSLLSSRYKERRASNRGSMEQPADVAMSSRFYTSPNNRSSLPMDPQQPSEQYRRTTHRDITSSSRYTERRSSANRSSLLMDQQQKKYEPEEQRSSNRDLATSSFAYVNRHASAQFMNSNDLVESEPPPEPRNITTSSRYVEGCSSYYCEPTISNHQSSTTINKRASYYGEYRQSPPIAPVVTSNNDTTQHRTRALFVPSSKQNNDEDQQQTIKPSLMPVSVHRYRRHSNNNLPRYASVPENEVAPTITKEVRFLLNKNRAIGNNDEIVAVPLVASRSTGGYSNSSYSSSGDLDYDPPTPSNSYNGKKRSIPVYNPKEPPQRFGRMHNYLERLKETHDLEQDATAIPRRQRVVSEDNEHYRALQRQQVPPPQQQKSSVTELLARVKQSRAKSAVYISKQ